jgi:hypothetical protein
MIEEHRGKEDPRIRAALAELQGLLRARYPDATFAVYEGEDPEGVYLSATVDVEDTDEVLNVVMERLLHLQDDLSLPIYVMPILPLERVAHQLHARGIQGRSVVAPSSVRD